MTAETIRSDAGAAVGEGVWTQQEHDRYLEALQLFPGGPWKDIADHVGTRSVRQVQTHAQKYHEKVARRLRGLRKERKKLMRPEHRIDDDMMNLCREVESERLSTVSSVSSSGASVDDGGGGVAYSPSPHHHRHRLSSLHYGEQRWGFYDFSLAADLEPRASASSFQSHEYLSEVHQQPSYSSIRSSGDLIYHDAFRGSHFLPRHESSDADADAQLQRPKPELPSFHDAMDFLIDLFSPKEFNDIAWHHAYTRRA